MSWILHVDLDQFQAAVEQLRRPDLRGRPVVVGGSGDPEARRMVVTSASYEARAFGVRAGMPLRAAARKCPDAVFLPLDHPAYEAASEQVMAVLRSFDGPVEVWGWDEAFLGTDTADPETLAATIRWGVHDRTALTCSVGIGENKQQAKLATGFAKPGRGDGVYRLTSVNWAAVMAERPVDALWGVGSRTARNLGELGLRTVADLATAPVDTLAERFGPRNGPWLRDLANGRGDTVVSAEPWIAKSRSKETTFPDDLTVRADVQAQLVRLTGEVVAEIDRPVRRVAVKVRTASFFTRTKISTLPAPTTSLPIIEATALAVLGRFELDRPVRLLGVRVEFDERTT